MLPPYITSTLASTFAGRTLRKRLPAILKSVIKKNRYGKEKKQCLQTLLNEIPYTPIKPIEYFNTNEEVYWEALYHEYADTAWIDLPFYLAEALFYRKILTCTDWVKNGKDPFIRHKTESLIAQSELIAKLLEVTQQLLNKPFELSGFIFLLEQNLWGNQADLSLFHDGKLPESSQNKGQYLLHNDSERCAEFISQFHSQIDFLIDNTGVEFIGDMALALYLLKNEKVSRVNFHVKAAPIFVSDSMEADVEMQLLDIEKNHKYFKDIALLFRRYIKEGSISILSNLYWNSPLFYNWFPSHLKETLSQSSLIISKGDAHYRRFLQDRQWAYTDSLNHVIDFIDTPLWLLRTLKSEVLVGVEKEKVTEAERLDKNWLTNGKFGIIQFHNFK